MKKITLLLFLLFCKYAAAQKTSIPDAPKPFVFGVIHQLFSAQLNEIRGLNIYLPEEYYTDSLRKFPVIYLLDGSSNEDYPHIAGLTQFMSMYALMNPAIIVGIANIDRKRDFTFPTTIEKDKKDFPTTGGSAKFIAFIETELIPYINKTFRTSGDETIIGQSLGGLLATEVLLRKPDLFDSYIIVSPSLWWDNESLLKQAGQLLAARSNQNKKIYVGVGKEGRIMFRDAKGLYRLLKKKLPSSKVYFDHLPKETHATILHRCVYNAFEVMNGKK
jgi:uncharacterized protein